MSSWISSHLSGRRQQALTIFQQQIRPPNDINISSDKTQPVIQINNNKELIPNIKYQDKIKQETILQERLRQEQLRGQERLKQEQLREHEIHKIQQKIAEQQKLKQTQPIKQTTFDVIDPKTINNNPIILYPNIRTTDVVIISNILSGGTYKYVNELINIFNNNYIKYTKINTKNDLLEYNFTSNTIILLQQLIHTDINLETIINIQQSTKCILIVTIHDYSLFIYNENKYINDIHNIYLNKLDYDNIVQTFLNNCTDIIIPSKFVKTEINKTYNLTNDIIEHIDTLSSVSNTPYIPLIDTYTINIAIPTNLSEYKGEEFYNKLIQQYKTYNYNNKIYMIKFLLFIDKVNEYHIFNKYNQLKNVIIQKPYNEDELYDILHKYNIHLLLYLNKWGETYCYSLSKGLNTGLPIIYSNIGAFTERIPDTPYYFKIEPDLLSNIINIDTVYSKFPSILNYIINNTGSKCTDKEQFIHIPTFYTKLFNKNIFDYLNNLYITNINQYNKIFDIVQPYAIYFPQFHETIENNNTFYKGYSDMINLNKMKTIYNNIQTPLSGLLGYYNLKYNNCIIDTQILLAKSYGFKGFGIYYYWFSKNTITNKNKIFNDVIDKFFKTNIIGFDVFFIYANESWSNNPAFGNTNNIIINEYTNDNLNKFANDLSPYFIHSNYRKIDNKPVFLLHQPWEITDDNIDLMYTILDNKCKQIGFDGIHFILNSISNTYSKYNQYYNHPEYKNIKNTEYFVQAQNRKIYYDKYVNNFINTTTNEKQSIIKSCFTNFNNCVRFYNKLDKYNIYTNTNNCNINIFANFISKQLVYYKNNTSLKSDISKIMLFNAWNEWGEQMVIEPSNELGYTYLEIIKSELLKLI